MYFSLAKLSSKLWATKAASFFLVFLLLVITACQPKSKTEQKLEQEITSTKEESLSEGGLVLDNASLEQADEEGDTLWKIKAERAVYDEDNKIAKIEQIEGSLFQEGEVVLQVRANSGEIDREGTKISLQNQIVAVDPRNGAVIRGEEVQWLPKEDLLIVNDRLSGSNQKFSASANSGRYLTKKQHLELVGDIEATAKELSLKMKSDRLTWLVKDERVVGSSPIQIDRFQEATITDRVVADNSEVDLNTKIVQLRNNVELKSIETGEKAQPLQIATNSAIWNLDAETVMADKPLRIVYPTEKITLTANRGLVDLKQEVARLSDGVEGVSTDNQANLVASQLTWDIPTQRIQAMGNVFYRQADPPFSVSGPRAIGKLQDQSIVVSGGNTGTRVVTEIIPEER
ncbi:LPS export ABC transporter periplasmic protein LptC [Oscillatoria salina]|uniref:LPS export ABC transporter periplasmic protein LptC n=1 Tax=Oscillatoria salina TaxID=331517 RepID=UPI001CCD30FB|nr:LPS export ABC transporter periplasmic protein LptC [Oscillatoria salina]MBZ8182907.1 LPS export ABC transporter periplasmic protein LptC [Oscillatoria salina IIICB1]